jgi:hypothetical protein
LRTRIFRVGRNDMDKQPIMHTCAMQRVVEGEVTTTDRGLWGLISCSYFS